jgi:hypothetical protein
MRVLLLCLVILSAQAADEAARIPWSGKPQVVWDGDTYGGGSGWAASPASTSSIDAKAPEARTGKIAMRLQVKAKDWSRFGWNWHSWDSINGTNVKARTHLLFSIRVTGASHPTKLGVFLTGMPAEKGKPASEGPTVEATGCEPSALDGRWHEVAIPLATLAANAAVDLTNLQQVCFVPTAGGNEMDCAVLIDNIAFATAAK